MNQVAFDFALDDPGGETYGVAQLSAEINGMLRRRFEDGVWVRGEIQDWKKHPVSGHIYFDLVDRDSRGKVCTLKVAFFAGVQHGPRQRLRRANLKLAEGLTVRIFGTLDFHAERGQLSLLMTDIDPRFTLGEMALQRQVVVERLLADGRYDANRRVPMPPVPLCVGVVTSIGSAAYHDFTAELGRSALAFDLRVADVRVQGRDAVPTITAALPALVRAGVEVIVVVRGGGARGDLAAFDTEEIATAIAASSVPVFTGLGHETDRTVADEVAHLALKTPTACAAELVERVFEFIRGTEQRWQAIARSASQALGGGGANLDGAAHSVRRHGVAAVARADERVGHRSRRLHRAAEQTTGRGAQHLAAAQLDLARAGRRLDDESRHLDGREARVRLLDPRRIMARGWSITRDERGQVVRDAAELSPGDLLNITFARGAAASRVETADG